MSFLHLITLLAVALVARSQTQLLRGSCTFEADSCGYTSDPAYAAWTINDEGRFITAESLSFGEKEKHVLVSPELELRDWSCVRLVYQISGSGSLQLHLRSEEENFDYMLWSAEKPSDSWLIASVDLRNISGSYQLLFEAKPTRGMGNSVAVFEIHIIPGYCMECNFEEHHLCGYSNQWNPNVNWYVGGSLVRDPRSNLPDDHTMNNGRGHYMYVDSVYAKRFQEVAKLVSPMTTTPMTGCLSFYYQRDQAIGNFFSVFTKDQLGHYEEIWRPDVYATSSWKLVQVDIKAPHPLEVVFEVAFNSARGGHVALDDISFSSEFCHTETEPEFDPSVANCDFEEGLCQYYQEQTGGSLWNKVSVKPNVYRIGDHTTGTGSFLLTNTRHASRPGYVGRLFGPFLPGNHKYCLRFYYALHGFMKIDNALALYVYDENNIAQEKLWTVSERSRDVWTEVEVTYLKPMSTKVAFVSICRNFWDCGLVSLDDISVTLGDCRVNAGPLNPPPGHCNFETGDCGYTQKKKAKKGHWLRIRGQTPTSYTGPKGDHTLGVGYFMYIEASHMLPKQSAQLMSTELRGSSVPQCLIFFYHMYGSGTGTLSILLRKGDKERLLWSRQGEQSVSWMKAMVDYECYTRHWVIFEATRGSSIRSDIAIDDVVFKKGPCKDPGDSVSYSGFSENFNEIEY
ncbi:MAM domain-containing protein 2a isoform X1 [Danio aesculapii]|uniref:MAM domain-containing protein 2a isoform X1 n=1 Tax=Danio aesculapii TaxID=1142201 RepID=UPI0024C019A5|nr:MAM domain-containing protein 2a isoform X1 [Danio aesculapii]